MLRRVAAELERYDDAGRLRPSVSPVTASERPRGEETRRAAAEAE
jgi:hypothetical protein